MEDILKTFVWNPSIIYNKIYNLKIIFPPLMGFTGWVGGGGKE